MSDVEKLMGKLDAVETSLDEFKKSHNAQKEADAKGVEKLQTEIAEMRTQNQEFAELAKKGIPREARDICASLGETVIKSFLDPKGKAASEGTDTAGGYVVEDDVRHDILSAQNQYGLVRKLFGAAVYPMKSDVTTVPVDSFEESGNMPVPAAVSENAQISESDDAVLDQVTLTAAKQATLNYISQELMDDSFVDFLGAYLMPKLARQASKREDTIVFTTASTGLLNTSNVQVKDMDSGDTAFQNITIDYLTDMEDEVVDDALEMGRYIMHRSILSIVRKLKGDDGQYLWAAAAAGEPPTIGGYEYEKGSIFPAKSASAVSTGFVLFGDITKGCVVGERKERRIETSKDFRFDYDQVAVRMIFRFAYSSNANIGRAISVLKTAAV